MDDVVVPADGPIIFEVSDLNVDVDHFDTPDFWRSAGKTGIQPHMRPTDISTVLENARSAWSVTW